VTLLPQVLEFLGKLREYDVDLTKLLCNICAGGGDESPAPSSGIQQLLLAPALNYLRKGELEHKD
jgi:hypothetical protein